MSDQQDPRACVRNYGRGGRGMTLWRDVEDWLGGLPFEFSDEPEFASYVEARGCRVVAARIDPPGGNNEYLLERRA